MLKNKVLLVKTSSMGDLIHTFPAVTDLCKHRPQWLLSWLVEEKFADLVSLHPFVQSAFALALRRWRHQLFKSQTWKEISVLKQTLRQAHFNEVLDSQGLIKSALPALWSHVPVKGYDKNSIKEPLASMFYHQKYSVSRALSAIERNRRLFAAAFGYTFDENQIDFGIVAPARLAWVDSPYSVFLHATSRASKEWSESHWQALGVALFEKDGRLIVLPWGSPQERARAERLAVNIPNAMVAPAMRLTEAAALLGHAKSIVGVDTGLTHLANALDRPLVAIYTDTDPVLTGVVASPRACNLGNAGVCPSVDEVWLALEKGESSK